jgi:hypothetical protein
MQPIWQSFSLSLGISSAGQAKVIFQQSTTIGERKPRRINIYDIYLKY